MKKTMFALLACLLILLCGCQNRSETEPQPTETVPATVPPDGNPEDVTCKGSYTAALDAARTVASVGEAELTNGQLQAWYWAQVAQYRQAGHETAPDFSRPLDVQICEIDKSVASWQQYFLKQALTAWHSAQALMAQGEAEGVPTEEAYRPRDGYYEKYMTGMPAAQVLYGYHDSYKPNSMHKAYLDALPEMLESLAKSKGYANAEAMAEAAFGSTKDAVLAFGDSYNRGYMYFTSLSYQVGPTEAEIEAYRAEQAAEFSGTERCVDIRHILLVPDDTTEEAWTACEMQAAELLETWMDKTKATEADFADLANKHSQDTGSASNGGAYWNLREGQLIPELERWCFDAARQEGDTTLIRTDSGWHIVYFARSTESGFTEAKQALTGAGQQALTQQACDAYPMEVDYSAITLTEAEGTVSAGEILYADVAHERFPEVPLYLQQDYPDTMYGNYPIVTNGCGITSLAMLASYLADDELTPPEMCARYGNYSFNTGTSGRLFEDAPAQLGFYLIKKSYDWREARDYMREGHPVIVVQYKGFWTSGGHYLVLEKLSEDGLVQVRDSNIYNYRKLQDHKQDLFSWDVILPKGMGYWIYEKKVTSIPACTRCGTEDSLVVSDYVCEKCAPAILRRNTYLEQ